MTVQRILSAAGFTTVPADDGQQALDLIAEHGDGSLDAIVLDLEMPRLDGWQVIRSLRSARPWLIGRIVILSGCCAGLPRDIPALSKPVSPERLVALVQRVTGSGAP